MTRADLLVFGSMLEAKLYSSLPDPRDAKWLAVLMLTLVREKLAGQTIPSQYAFVLADKEARAAELLPQGAAVASVRIGCSRSSVYRRAAHHKSKVA